MKSYYEFNGNWLHIFDKLVGIITPSNIAQFTIWEHRSTNKPHLLIVNGVNLSQGWEQMAGVNRISESEFIRNSREKIGRYIIHGAPQPEAGNKGLLSFVVKTINNIFII